MRRCLRTHSISKRSAGRFVAFWRPKKDSAPEGTAGYFGLRGKFHRFERLSAASRLSIVFGLLTTIATDGQARSVSYNEFKQLVRAGKVGGVTINQDRIRGTLKEADQPLVAIRIEDPGLVAELELRNFLM